MKFQLSEKVISLGIFTILTLGTLLRLIKLESDPFWIDERGHISVALSPTVTDLFAGVREHAAAAPLDYLLLRFYQRLTGAEARFELGLPYVFYGVVSIYLIYKLGRLIYNPVIGLLSAFSLSISFFHIYYSQEVRFYSLSLLIGLASSLAFISARNKPTWQRWLLWGFVCILGLYTHYFLLFVFCVQIGWLLFTEIRSIRKTKSAINLRIIQPGFTFAISCLTFLPWLIWAGNAPLSNSSHLGISFSQALMSFILDLGPSLAFLVFSFFGVFSKKESWLLLGMVLIPFLSVYTADNLAGYFFNARQVIFTLPFSIILGSASFIYFATRILQTAEQQNKAYWKTKFVIAGVLLLIVFTLANGVQIWEYFAT